MNIAHPFAIQHARTRRLSATPGRLVRISTVATLALVVVFAAFMLALAGFTLYGSQHSDRVYSGATLAGVDVGGMSREDLTETVDTRFEDLASTTVTFSDGSNEYPVTAADLGVSLDRDATIDRAMAWGRDGAWWDRSVQWTRGLLLGHEVAPAFAVDEAQFRGAMTILAPNVVFAPSDARVDLDATAGVTLVSDVPGQSLNVSLTRDRVIRQLAGPGDGEVMLGLIALPAGVLSSDVQGGMPDAERALSSIVKVEATEGSWGISRSMLSSLVSIGPAGDMVVDRGGVQAFVEGIAEQVNHPAENASVVVDVSQAIVAAPQVNSASVDIEASTDRVVESIQTGETTVDLVVARQEPEIRGSTAQEWATRAEQLVGNGLTLTWPGGESQLGRADLVAALTIEAKPGENEPFALGFDRDVLAATLEPLQEDLDIPVREARFRLIDGQIKFQEEARGGRAVNVGATVDGIVAAVYGGGDGSELVLNALEPSYTGADRESIVLGDVLGESVTYYGTSSSPRRKNVERAVELEDGWLIPPGGEFSYAEIMGLVNEANGFVTGFGIVADPNGGVKTAPVIGGGICQVSTTIFQAAFWAGLEIEERWAHPYWIESYGQEPYGMLGLDAMVNIEPGWALDLRFRNTTPNWIAVELVADGVNVTTRILGVDPGWDIQVSEPALSEIVTPEEGMIFTDTPELPQGQELQVEYAREGFTSTVIRVVRDENGRILEEYSYSSSYTASRDRTLRGTGEN